MKRSIAFALLAVCSFSASSQGSPNDVSAVEISIYKLGIETGCRNGGKRDDPREKVEAFCSCVMRVLNETMADADWQRAYYYSRKRLDREEQQILMPHMQKLQTCRAHAS